MDIAFQWKTAESNTANCPPDTRRRAVTSSRGGGWMRRPARSYGTWAPTRTLSGFPATCIDGPGVQD